MSYRLEITTSARKALARLPMPDRRRLDEAILGLADDPRPAGCVNLAGRRSTYRIRRGDYRIVYEVRDVVRVVEVQAIGHRKDIYRDL